MLKYIVLFLISFCASLALTPLVRLLALRIGAVDRPGARKIQTKPIPRLGGVGVVLSVVVAILSAFGLDQVSDSFIPIDQVTWAPVLLGGAIVFVAGVWDDIRPLSAGTKFVFQASAAGAAIWSGIRIEQIFF